MGNVWIDNSYRESHDLRLCQVIRFTCEKSLGSAFALCFAQLEALPGDATHLWGTPGLHVRIVLYKV